MALLRPLTTDSILRGFPTILVDTKQHHPEAMVESFVLAVLLVTRQACQAYQSLVRHRTVRTMLKSHPAFYIRTHTPG